MGRMEEGKPTFPLLSPNENTDLVAQKHGILASDSENEIFSKQRILASESNSRI
jgi:hypothetical protein